ncbi:hypothetical protein CA54_41100 [Symmachiella macrocystis]|uniref:Recombinase n=2 Tax=Symmachiella macrocystis TaxID=2527985 RepID=A0A5C6BBN3_9PLAN|nr:hypothetical protein CA54_41100 [Symmachiella macrocystis]
MKKENRYVGFVRVSSREQEREGFSLSVQEDGLRNHAERRGGVLVKLFRVAETASRHDERTTFRKFIKYVKQHAAGLDGVLFYKIDRAARNLFDYVELERLESEHGVPFESVTQPSDNSPSGRMFRRSLATMASFQTEQQSLDVRDGLAKRVEEGLFPSRAPYGYKNVRKNKRGLIETDESAAMNVQRIFELFTQHAVGVEKIVDQLFDEGHFYSPSHPRFSESKVYGILHDESYLGKIRFRDDWHPGTHGPLVTQAMFDTAQALLGNKTYRSHQMVYASELIRCGHCGRPITGEPKTKETSTGMKTYSYYRCSRYSRGQHPRIRLTEKILDTQILAFLERLDDRFSVMGDWMSSLLESKLGVSIQRNHVREKELKRQLANCEQRSESLCNKWIDGKIDDERYELKRTEIDQQIDILQSQLDEQRTQITAAKELSKDAGRVFRIIIDRWPTATYQFKRRVLESVFERFKLDSQTLALCDETPFELLLADR